MRHAHRVAGVNRRLEGKLSSKTEIPSGYRLPSGMTMADVRKADRKLLASEGIRV